MNTITMSPFPGPPLLQKFEIALLATLTACILCSCGGAVEVSGLSLVNNPNPDAPLVGILTFTTDRAVTPTLTISDGDNIQVVTPDPERRKDHEILVLGLRPGRTHEVSVNLRDRWGIRTNVEPLEITTPPLPEDFPPIELVTSDSSAMEPGITMFDIFRWEGPFKDDSLWSMAIAVDEVGEVVWFRRFEHWIDELRRNRDGNLMFNGKLDGRLMEMDMKGNVLGEWHTAGVVHGDLHSNSAAVATDCFHHDVLETSSGDFIGLGLEAVKLENFPLAYPPKDSSGTAYVAGDVLIQFDREGKTLRKWSVTDIIDPRRMGEGSLDTWFYESLYKSTMDSIPFDITHCNALYYMEEEDALVVSSNHQCAIFKVDMSTGELLWILGDPTGWQKPWSDKLLTARGDLTWPCHQHGIEMTPNGTLLVYDNGASRKVPPQESMPLEEQYSRVVEYRIDEDARTVEEVWTFGPEEERFLSPFISDADYLPETGNILVTDGGRFRKGTIDTITTWGGWQWARLFEVTYPGKQKIWEIRIADEETRYSVYRGHRLKSLYPKLDRPTG